MAGKFARSWVLMKASAALRSDKSLLLFPLLSGFCILQSVVAITVSVVVVVLGFILLGLIQISLQGIYAAAVYRYAEAGEASVGFDQALLQQAFASRKK